VELAAEILESIDESKSPCDDFYNFACGQWEQSHYLPPGEGVLEALTVLGEQNNVVIIKALEAISESDIDAVKKAKYLYDSCQNMDAINEAGATPLLNLLSKAGGWALANVSSKTPWKYSQLAMDQMMGSQALFSMSVGADNLNSSVQSISLGASGLSLTIPAFYQNTKLVTLLTTYMSDVLALLGNSDKSAVAQGVSDVVDLEKSLAKVSVSMKSGAQSTPEGDLPPGYNNMTIANISSSFPMPADFNWLEYFKAFFHSVGQDANITDQTVVIVSSPDYLKALSKLLATAKPGVVENYVKWQLALPNIPLLSTPFRRLADAFYEDIGGEGGSPDCVSVTQNGMPFVVSRLYTAKDVIPNTRSKMNTTINNILTAFNARIQAKDWLDDTTKKRCEDKVNAITRQIAYPDFINDDKYLNNLYSSVSITPNSSFFDNTMSINQFTLLNNLRQFFKPTDKESWDLPPTVVNAYYDPSFNQFVFLEGILHPPLFHPEWPDYFLYGSMGIVIGHELTHGFDNNGQKYDLHGNYRQWWTKSSQKNFNDRTKCYVDQYGNYTFMGFKINGELTLGENIADNGGIHTSFQAYKTVAKGSNPDLPVFGGKYTHDQMFFIAFGQLWCSIFSKNYLQESTKEDPHSPGPIRVLGSLSNSADFAKAFSCPSGSKYNPTNKCELW
jgi:predicted metalloendopeptidase